VRKRKRTIVLSGEAPNVRSKTSTKTEYLVFF